MNIELRHLRYAVAAAETRSFARAAKAFNVKQSTLSRKIGDLEILVGLKLFERTTMGARPTQAATTFLPVPSALSRTSTIC